MTHIVRISMSALFLVATPALAQPEFYAFGLPHQARGNAVLTIDPIDGSLIISNIGHTGEDGVSTTIGSGGRLYYDLSDIGFSNMPDLARLTLDLIANLQGGGVNSVATTLFEVDDKVLKSAANWAGIGSDTYRVTILDANGPVFSESGYDNYSDVPVWPVKTNLGIIGWTYIDITNWPGFVCIFQPPYAGAESWFNYYDPILGQFKATEFSSDLPTIPVESTHGGTLLGRGTGDLRIHEMYVGIREGIAHSALGNVKITLEQSGARLRAYDFAPSGVDGLKTLFLAPAGSYDARVEPLLLSSAGMRLRLEATGSLNGQINSSLGFVALENVSNTVEYLADFSSIGTNNVRIEAFLAGQMVGSTVVPGGQVVARTQSIAYLDRYRKLGEGQTKCFAMEYRDPILLVTSDNQQFHCDETRFLQADGPGGVDFLTHMLATTSSIADLVIIDETVQSVPRPLALSVGGNCPGQVTVNWMGAPPNATVALIYSKETGSLVIPYGPCQGTVLGLGIRGARLVATYPSDTNGQGSRSGSVGTSACGGYVQMHDLPNCTLSNVDQIQ